MFSTIRSRLSPTKANFSNKLDLFEFNNPETDLPSSPTSSSIPSEGCRTPSPIATSKKSLSSKGSSFTTTSGSASAKKKKNVRLPAEPIWLGQKSMCAVEEMLALESYKEEVAKSKSKKEKAKEVKERAESKRNTIPTPLETQKIFHCRVYTEDGRNIAFKDIIRGNVQYFGGPTVVIFVRHMWCGLCQEYLKSVRRIQEECYTSQGVQVIVIGCGDSALIRQYKQNAKWNGQMYADPSGALQDMLGMDMRSLDAGKESDKGEYQQRSMLKNGLVSAANGLKMLNTSRKPGSFDRLGGEFVFTLDEENRLICSYAHRMTNTRDHGPLEPLFKAAGVENLIRTDVSEVEDEEEMLGMSCPMY